MFVSGFVIKAKIKHFSGVYTMIQLKKFFNDNINPGTFF